MSLILMIFVFGCMGKIVQTSTQIEDQVDAIINQRIEKRLQSIQEFYDEKTRNLESKLGELEKELKAVKGKRDADTIAFTVTAGDSKTYSQGARIEFDSILTNEGAGYIVGQHEFICPQSGLYMFTLSSVGMANGPNGILEIWKEDEILVTAFGADGTNSAATNTAFSRCDSGSKVYVQCNPVLSCGLYGTGYGYTNIVAFSGFLVAAEDD